MRKSSRIAVFAIIICILSVGHPAFAQWDSKGCSDYGTNIAYPESFESSLWTFRSDVWDGYVDFQEEGKYWTHWGYGTWKVTPEGKLHMANDYNGKSYDLTFKDNGFQFDGIRNDGLRISGKLICAKYEGPGPKVSAYVEEEIKKGFKELLQREPTLKELQAQFRLYNQGKTLDVIKESLKDFQEYQDKEAARAAEAAEAARNAPPGLGW